MLTCDKVRKARKKLGYSRRELSDKLGCSKMELFFWEYGFKNIEYEYAVSLSKLLGIDLGIITFDTCELCEPGYETNLMENTLSAMVQSEELYQDFVKMKSHRHRQDSVICLLVAVSVVGVILFISLYSLSVRDKRESIVDDIKPKHDVINIEYIMPSDEEGK